jgi:DNA-binding transcriptional LysR family regulator
MLDSVTINQLRAFVAVAEEGSFSGAARKLRRAQSAVSHAVIALEGALQVPLFERDARKARLSAAGRNLLADARAVIARTEEMKNRASSIMGMGAPQVLLAVDVYFPRAHLIDCLRVLQSEVPTVAISVRMTTMQTGERLVLAGECALAVTIADVPEVDLSAIERHWLRDTPMVTVCAPGHALASIGSALSRDELSQHVQLVVTDNQPDAERTQRAVAGKRLWLLNDLSAKHDFLRAGLGWGHMPTHLVEGDLATGRLVQLHRHAWHLDPLKFMVSRRRGHELSACEIRLLDLLGKSAQLQI